MPTPSISGGGIGGLNVDLDELRGKSLDVHLPPESDVDLIGGRSVIYNSISSVDDSGDIEFHVPPDPECYFVLNQARLEGCFVVKTDHDVKVVRMTKVTLAGHYCASLFSQIEIYLNGTQICDQSSTVSYPFKHHIDTTLSYHLNTVKYALRAEGHLPSHYDPCKMEYDDFRGIKATASCDCYKNTRDQIYEGKKVYFCSTIGADIFRADKYLPPNVDIKIKLKRFNRSFGILQRTESQDFAFSLQDVKLRMRKVLPSLTVRNRFNMKLISQPSFIAYEDTQLRHFHVPKESTSYSVNFINTDIGKLPLQVVFTLIDASVLSKERSEVDPYRFEHADLSSVVIKKNGKPLIPAPLECNFDDGNYIELFDHFCSNVGSKINVTPESFVDGKFFLFFDLTPDKCHSFHNHLAEPGNLELDLTFRKATPKAFSLIAYCVYNAALTIDSNGQVYKGFF